VPVCGINVPVVCSSVGEGGVWVSMELRFITEASSPATPGRATVEVSIPLVATGAKSRSDRVRGV
jgi:hypothetical protein